MTARIICLWIAVITWQWLGVQANDRPTIDLGQQSDLFQGDIRRPLKNRNGILKAKRWPNGIIYYKLDDQLDKNQVNLIQEAMRAIENNTCVRFKFRTNEPNYLVIQSKSELGCYSDFVGMHAGVQYLNLQDDANGTCMVHRIIVHELLHCVGLWHEHERYDRDEHIIIHWENIKNTTTNLAQFHKLKLTESDTYNISYNYLSVMHYRHNAYSSNGNTTMEPIIESYLNKIGNQAYAHEWDWEKVRRIYECAQNGNGDIVPLVNIQTTRTTTKLSPVLTTETPRVTSRCVDTVGLCSWLVCYLPIWNSGCQKTCRLC